MVLLTTTPRILECISALSPSQRLALGDDLSQDVTKPIPHSVLISLAKQSSRSGSLNALLRGTKPYVAPPPPKPEPSPEYKALMARLRAEQQQRDYNALLAQQSQEYSIDGDDEQDPISPSLVLNIVISIVCCAMAVFYASRWLLGDGLRVLLSLAAGVLVGVAEVVVYAAYLRNIKQSKSKERKKREKKSVIGEYKGPVVDTNADAAVTSTERELIWGKGKHGGARRRVKEKWEKQQNQDNLY